MCLVLHRRARMQIFDCQPLCELYASSRRQKCGPGGNCARYHWTATEEAEFIATGIMPTLPTKTGSGGDVRQMNMKQIMQLRITRFSETVRLAWSELFALNRITPDTFDVLCVAKLTTLNVTQAVEAARALTKLVSRPGSYETYRVHEFRLMLIDALRTAKGVISRSALPVVCGCFHLLYSLVRFGCVSGADMYGLTDEMRRKLTGEMRFRRFFHLLRPHLSFLDVDPPSGAPLEPDPNAPLIPVGSKLDHIRWSTIHYIVCAPGSDLKRDLAKMDEAALTATIDRIKSDIARYKPDQLRCFPHVLTAILQIHISGARNIAPLPAPTDSGKQILISRNSCFVP